MIRNRRKGPIKVSEVKVHAGQAMVDDGTVRHDDFVGNGGTDTAADLGKLRGPWVER